MKATIIKAKNRDKLAALTLVRKYRPLILKYSTNFHLKNYTVEDFIQEGEIAVLKAIDKYDVTKDTNSFNGYVIRTIKNSYNMLARKHIKYGEESSLDIYTQDGLCIMDFITDPSNIESEYINKWNFETLENSLFKLNNKEKTMLSEIFLQPDGSLRKYCINHDITFYYGNKALNKILSKLKAELI